MKKALFILLFLSYIYSNAQGNLQFSKVITYSGSTGGVNYTVPTDKIWKIETIGVATNYGNTYFNFNLNGITSITRLQGSGNLSNTPIWLKSGDIFNIDWYNNVTSSYAGYLISILEFNIIQ